MSLFLRRRAGAPALLLLAALGACASAGGGTAAPPPGEPTPDPAAVAAGLERATLPASPQQAGFSWDLDEAGAKFHGRGVARYQAPERARLDLFGPRGETYLAAALVHDTLRIPPALEGRAPIPSPALLWAALGVLHPPADARLTGVSTAGGDTLLRYAAGDDVIEYRARGAQLSSVRRLRRGGVVESIDLERSPEGTLRKVQYRDWPALRTLTLGIESTTDVSSFPDEIWSPPGTAR